MKIGVLAAGAVIAASGLGWAQQPTPTPEERAILEQASHLRSLPDDQWVKSVGEIAAKVHALPDGPGKGRVALSISNLATEGDAGHDALQKIAESIAQAVPGLPENVRPQYCNQLASLVRYEHLKIELDDPAYRAAMKSLEDEDKQRGSAEFTLSDIHGKSWKLSDLRGKVVLVNFWATWCPPCRKEMPDLQALFDKYKGKGLIVLAISDEEEAKVKPFIQAQGITFPVMLDPGDKVHQLFQVEGIPKSFVYDRDGKLVAQSIDMRTRGQFLEMLGRAGLK